jgi:proteasome lid subunit RPN8/RPN11
MEMALPRPIRRRLHQALTRAGANEIGGILMGRELSPGCFEIVDFSLDEMSGSHEEFVRDHEVHNKVLADFFERTGRDYATFNYLGEWHSHPSFPVLLSKKDMDAMHMLVNEDASTPFAALLIVRIGSLGVLEACATLHQRDRATEFIQIAA